MSSQLVYIDTNVFAILLLPHPQSQDPCVKQAYRFIEDIESGKYTGITSSLTEMEYRGVVKRRLSEKKGCQVSTQEEDAAMYDFSNFIQELGIGVMDADIVALDRSANTVQLRLFTLSANTVQNSSPCYINNQWKMIRSVDALTINIAVKTKADLFATFDRGFKGLSNSFITPLIISEVY
jgi:predicted nucleic acid-binding protein